ncbi:MAG: hypothetical protein P8J32_03520, partial [bacterium]|nr:hypothetical protein [bacterium]
APQENLPTGRFFCCFFKFFLFSIHYLFLPSIDNNPFFLYIFRSIWSVSMFDHCMSTPETLMIKSGIPTPPILVIVIHLGWGGGPHSTGGRIVQYGIAKLSACTHAMAFSLHLYRKFETICATEEFAIPETYKGPLIYTGMKTSVKIGKGEYLVRAFCLSQEEEARAWATVRMAELARSEKRRILPHHPDSVRGG